MYERVRRLTPWSSVLMVAGVLVALAMPATPDSTASGAKVLAFYQRHHDAMYVAATALVVAALAGILFFITCATFLRRRGADMLATACAVGAGIFGTGLLFASGTLLAANDSPSRMSADMARTLNLLQNDIWAPAMFGGIGIAVLCIGVSTLRTRALPKALAIIATVVGVATLSGIGSWFAFMACGPLSLVVAGYVSARWEEPRQITLPDVPAARVAAHDGQAQQVKA